MMMRRRTKHEHPTDEVNIPNELAHTTKNFVRYGHISKHKIHPDISDFLFTCILVFGDDIPRNIP